MSTAVATEVKERPILFSAPMVRAILEGRKTQTRRVVKWKPRSPSINLEASSLRLGHYFTGVPASGWVLRSMGGPCWEDRTYPNHCPYGKPGDQLWVRETWWEYKSPELHMAAYADGGTRTLLENGATHDEPQKEIAGRLWVPADYDIWQKRPSMPRWASRITLEITNVRVERLNEISKADAIAEGIQVLPLQSEDDPSAWYQSAPGVHQERTAQAAYRALWESINGDGSWAANPWVWVISFRRVK